jgi:hypothetical protein
MSLRFPLGYLLPIRTTARLYLARRLAQHGVHVGSIPKACLQELADDAVANVKSIAKLTHRRWREIVTFHLDEAAANIASVLDGTARNDMAGLGYEIMLILKKHGILFPPASSAASHRERL